MKKLDKYLGPLVLGIINLFSRFAQPTPRAFARPHRCLFLGFHEMGALIVARPAILDFKQRWPQCATYFVCLNGMQELIRYGLDVEKDKIKVIRTESFFLFLIDFFHVLHWIKKKKFCVCFDLDMFSYFAQILLSISKVKNKVAFRTLSEEGPIRSSLLTYGVRVNPSVHVSQNYMDLIRSFSGANLNDSVVKSARKTIYTNNSKTWDRKCSTSNVKQPIPFLPLPISSICLFYINSGRRIPQRDWGLENFSELAKILLLENRKRNIVLIGDARDFDQNEKLKNQFRTIRQEEDCAKRIFNVAGKVSFPELLWLFEHAEGLIAGDSGPAHFASLTKVKKIVLFGPESPKRFAPFGKTTALYTQLSCSPCLSPFNSRSSSCQSSLCLHLIKPNYVAKRYLRLIDGFD